jgi:hypothetical protein
VRRQKEDLTTEAQRHREEKKREERREREKKATEIKDPFYLCF